MKSLEDFETKKVRGLTQHSQENNRSMRTLIETQNQETQKSNSNHSKEIIHLTTKYRVFNRKKLHGYNLS